VLKEVWIYKVRFPDGGEGYERKDERLSVASSGAPTLHSLAISLTKDITAGGGVAVHFQPPYDLEIKHKFVDPRRCLPLNEKEIQVVFDALSSSESTD